MPLFNDILVNPLNLIESYIQQNKFYTQNPSSMSLFAQLSIGFRYYCGQNTTLTAKKVKMAEEFLVLLRECIDNYNNTKNKEPLEIILINLQGKVQLESRSILNERINQNIAEGSYDASLAVFTKLIAFMLERKKELSFAVMAETEKPESHTTKILIFLEKTLFIVKFYSFVQEQGSLLNMPISFTKEHSEYISKVLEDTIPALHSTKIDKKDQQEEEILSKQRTLLKTIISGLMFNFQDKQYSVGVKNIMDELCVLKQTIEKEQIKYEKDQQHLQLHGQKRSPTP